MLTREREEHIEWGWQESDQTMCRPLLISLLSVCSFYLVVVLTKMCTCDAHHHSTQMMLINVLVLSFIRFFLSVCRYVHTESFKERNSIKIINYLGRLFSLENWIDISVSFSFRSDVQSNSSNFISHSQSIFILLPFLILHDEK